MELKKILAKNPNAKKIQAMVRFVGQDAERFNELVILQTTADERTAREAALVVSYCVMAHPELVKKHFKKLVAFAQQPHHPAILRNTFRWLQIVSIPKNQQRMIWDFAFTHFQNKKQPIAIRVFAMTVLKNIALQWTDLIPELRYAIQQQIPSGTAALHARARMVLKELDEVEK